MEKHAKLIADYKHEYQRTNGYPIEVTYCRGWFQVGDTKTKYRQSDIENFWSTLKTRPDHKKEAAFTPTFKCSKYIAVPTAVKGQSILESVERRNGNSVIAAVSIQLPTEKAKQIVEAFNFIESFASLTDNDIRVTCLGNVKNTLDSLRFNAKRILQ